MDLQWLLLIAGYVLGCFPSALLVGRYTGHDPTKEGSHNPGVSNVFRLAGHWPAAWVLVSDVAKGAAAAGIGFAVDGRLLGAACGAAAVVGHILPFVRPLSGGKGVATWGGALLMLYPMLGGILLGVWVLTLVAFRKASVASLLSTLVTPLLVGLSGRPATEVGIMVGVAVLVVLRHHENIRRLLHREELSIVTR